jgi:hypothetical protein
MATATGASLMPSKGLTVHYKPHEEQEAFHAKVLEKRWTAFCGGVRSGKTVAGCQEMIRQAFVLQPGSYGAVFAPTYPMLRDVVLKTCYDILPPEIMQAYRKSDNVLPTAQGGEIIFRSMEKPDNNTGTTLNWIWAEEPSLMVERAWRVMVARLSGGGPGADKRRGWGTMTPKGRKHWTGREFAVENQDHGAVFVDIEANRANLPPGYIEEMERAYTGKFAEQELRGRFVSFEGLIYDVLQEELHHIERPVQEMAGGFFGAIDWGYTNPCVIGVAGVDGDDAYHFFEELHQSHLLLEAIIDQCRDFMTRYAIQRFFCGPDRPENIAALNEAGIPAEAANDDRVDGICTVAALLALGPSGKPSLTFSPNVAKTYAEMTEYQWRQTAEGKPDKEEPLKVADHGPDMVRYLVHTHKRFATQAPGVVTLNWLRKSENS